MTAQIVFLMVLPYFCIYLKSDIQLSNYKKDDDQSS